MGQPLPFEWQVRLVQRGRLGRRGQQIRELELQLVLQLEPQRQRLGQQIRELEPQQQRLGQQFREVEPQMVRQLEPQPERQLVQQLVLLLKQVAAVILITQRPLDQSSLESRQQG